jgi:hypothetical protein
MTLWIGMIGYKLKSSSHFGESKKKDMLTEKGQLYFQSNPRGRCAQRPQPPIRRTPNQVQRKISF